MTAPALLRARGFTLTEVAFSIAIMVTAVVTVLLLLSASLRTVQRSRMGSHSAAMAMTLLERFQQDDEDFRSRQDDNNPYTKAFVTSKDGNIDSIERRADRAVSGLMAHFMTPGQFDLETRLLCSGLIIPVPTTVARRLDSPGDAIGRMLDAGGRLYYFNPAEVERAAGSRVVGQQQAADESKRIVFGVLGSAQQNIQVTHPFIIPQRQLYPFPPLGQHTRNVVYKWERDVLTGTPLTFNGRSCVAGDLPTADSMVDSRRDPYNNGYGSMNLNNLWHGTTWHEQAYIDELTGFTTTTSKWRAGEPEFWRLANHHWNRIYHQLRSHSYVISAGTREVPVYSNVTRTITEKVVKYDRFLNPTFEDITRTITEQVQTGTRTENVNGRLTLRGVPSPPLGLPQMQGARGTDILYEDAETMAVDRWNQLRVGLPGLERRVMYRTAALALWGKVDGHGSVTEVGLHELHSNGAGSPNVIRAGAIPAGRNPLLDDIPLPTNPRDIHPSQVLALSYVAHAAILVTGYKPPFVDEKNSMDPTTHANLVPDEDAPYKNPVAGEFYLFHPFYRGADAGTNRTPLSSQPSTAATPLQVGVVAANDPRIARDMDGKPIVYKRVSGDVVNPFPGPYADRGAFDWRGAAYWTRDPNTLRITSHGSAGGPTDSQMARTAMENCLRWAMAYVRENPYDMLIPRPYNSPTSLDRPLFAYDLFNSAGNALRKPAAWNNANLYTAIWGSDNALWPQQYSAAGRNWSIFAWTNTRENRDRTADNTVRPPPLRRQKDEGGATIGAAEYHDIVRLLDVTGEIPDDVSGTIETFAGTSVPTGNRFNKLANGHPRAYDGNNYRGVSEQTSVLATWNGYTNPYSTVVTLGTPVSADMERRLRMRESPQRTRWWYDQPFKTADRTRQLVFWSVDWLAFEDAESQPSEPVDLTYWNLRLESASAPGSGSVLSRHGHPETALMWANPARDGKNLDPPQKDVVNTKWKYDGNNVYRYKDSRSDYMGSGIGFTNIIYMDGDHYPWSRVGTWGADRNANGVWDRGRVPASARMKAEEVARFLYYDPVLWTTLGN